MSDSIQRLKDPKLSMTELMPILDGLDRAEGFEKAFSIGLSGNITTDLLGTSFRRQAYLHGLRPRIENGSYDAHIDNVRGFVQSGMENALILPFFDNLLPSLESRVSWLDPAVVMGLQAKVREELRLALTEAQPLKQVFLGLCHSIAHPETSETDPRLREALESFNGMLVKLASEFGNVRTLDLGAVVETVGWLGAFNLRFYYKFKAPYAAPLCEELARQVMLMSRGGASYYYKALVLDCDNTLWGGIIGEDLVTGIQLGPHDYPGNIFWMVQNEIVKLQKAGVLVCLCSKNNPADVDEAFSQHAEMVLKDEHILLKKVNWENKVENIRAIAQELNIGLDSLIFLDDSEFETSAVQTQLPMVRTFRVPKNVFEYPALMRQVRELFVAGGITGESADKTSQYRQLALADQERQKFGNQEEYLKSLGLKLEVRKNSKKHAPRISELTQKSNQFNLTTRRYTENEIVALMEAPTSAVYSFNVMDKFGDHGLTGIAIVRYSDKELVIDNFLMSCRVIGRGIEFAFWERLFQEALEKRCETVTAEFIRSAKNNQVEKFYDQLGLPLVEASEGQRRYAANLRSLTLAPQPHVEVQYVY